MYALLGCLAFLSHIRFIYRCKFFSLWNIYLHKNLDKKFNQKKKKKLQNKQTID